MSFSSRCVEGWVRMVDQQQHQAPWEQIGSGFVQHYYKLFDTDRGQLATLYVSILLCILLLSFPPRSTVSHLLLEDDSFELHWIVLFWPVDITPQKTFRNLFFFFCIEVDSLLDWLWSTFSLHLCPPPQHTKHSFHGLCVKMVATVYSELYPVMDLLTLVSAQLLVWTAGWWWDLGTRLSDGSAGINVDHI